MTILVEGESAFLIGGPAQILADDRECAAAWASPHVSSNPALKWILGKYVEADRANSNKQFWAFGDLQMARPTVSHAPLNILHRPKHIVGAFTATEMIFPTVTGEQAAGTVPEDRPYIEALAAFWRYYFPEELQIIEAAHNQGALFFSMECVAKSVTCSGEFGCGVEFAFAGPKHDTYCDHLNGGGSIKQLNSPHFLAGALIVPPASPGWKGAQIKEISELLDKHEHELEGFYETLKAETPHLEAQTWEGLMIEFLQKADAEANDTVPPGGKPYPKKKKTPKKLADDVRKGMADPTKPY